MFTAGVAQSYINLHNTMVGKEVVILGSGDIGMIMARRMTLEGAHVKAVFEIMPYPSGLPRNIEQCLNDYGIPLYLSHTVTNIHGKTRLEGITVSKVDENLKPVPGTEQEIACDTLILSVGLIPENELSIDAGVELDPRHQGRGGGREFPDQRAGHFWPPGNVLHVHDLVDFVSMEAESLADSAAAYIENGGFASCGLLVKAGEGIGHTIPQKISGTKDITLSMRPSRQFKDAAVAVSQNGTVIARKKMKKAIPAEMIELSIKKETLSDKGDLEVSIEC